jgi:hypothetical protein
MAKTFIGPDLIKKIYIGNNKIKKVYIGSSHVYSASHIVTYHINTNNIVQKEIDDDTDAISQAPTAELSGWTFVGWREDQAANPTVISSKNVLVDGIHLYAVFKQVVYLYYNGNGASGGSVATQSQFKYYNNSSAANPTFTVSSNGFTKTDNRFIGWGLNQGSTVQYSAGNSVALSASATMYAVWQLSYNPNPSQWVYSRAYMMYGDDNTRYSGATSGYVTWGGPRYVSQVAVYCNKWDSVAYGYSGDGSQYFSDDRKYCYCNIYGINDANNPGNRTLIAQKSISVSQKWDGDPFFYAWWGWIPVNGSYAGIWIEVPDAYVRASAPSDPRSWRTWQFSKLQLPF